MGNYVHEFLQRYVEHVALLLEHCYGCVACFGCPVVEVVLLDGRWRVDGRGSTDREAEAESGHVLPHRLWRG